MVAITVVMPTKADPEEGSYETVCPAHSLGTVQTTTVSQLFASGGTVMFAGQTGQSCPEAAKGMMAAISRPKMGKHCPME
jgi:hypothetical protein